MTVRLQTHTEGVNCGGGQIVYQLDYKIVLKYFDLRLTKSLSIKLQRISY